MAKIGSTLVCPICGKAFTAHSQSAKYCGPECKLENRRRYAREYERRARAEGRRKPLNLKRPAYSIQEIGRAARAAGMSYGDYVAKVGL